MLYLIKRNFAKYSYVFVTIRVPKNDWGRGPDTLMIFMTGPRASDYVLWMSHSWHIWPVSCPYSATLCPLVPSYVPTCCTCPKHVPYENAYRYVLRLFCLPSLVYSCLRVCPSETIRHLPFSSLCLAFGSLSDPLVLPAFFLMRFPLRSARLRFLPLQHLRSWRPHVLLLLLFLLLLINMYKRFSASMKVYCAPPSCNCSC